MLNKINNNHIVFLSIIVMILSFAMFEKSVIAQRLAYSINFKVGNNAYNDILYDPTIENLDLNGHAIVDAFNTNFVIDPGGDIGIRVNTDAVSTSLAGQFDGNLEVHGGALTLSGQIIQPNSTSAILNFPGFTDTPDEYKQLYLPPEVSHEDDFNKRTIITVFSDKVEGTDNIEDFPMLFQGRFDMLKHRDHGGHVSSTVGVDIAFSQDSDPNNIGEFLRHELVHYNSTTGDVIAWFNVESLDYNDNTPIYLWYGTDVDNNWEEPSITWGDYGGVYHLEDATDASEKNDGSFNHTPVTEEDVFIPTSTFPFSLEYSQYFDGSSDYLAVSSPSNWYEGNGIAVSAWIKVDSWPLWPGNYSIISIDDNDQQQSFHLWHDTSNLHWDIYHGNKGVQSRVSTALSAISEGDWHYISTVYNKNEDYQAIYVDGSLTNEMTVAGAGSFHNSTAALHVGGGVSGYADFTGYIDEVRLREIPNNSVYGEAVDQTQINNYLDPGTFYTVEVSDVGRILGVSSTEADVDFITDNSIYVDLIRSLWSQSALDIYFNTGNVIIGTGTPTGLLNLFSDTGTNAQINLQSGSTSLNDKWGIYNDESSNDLRFWNTNQVSGVNNMLLTTNSNVGIGTNTVNDNLTLAGQAYFIQSSLANTLNVYNYDTDGIAIYGEGFYGLQAISAGVSTEGISGEATGSNSIGLYGKGEAGVYGLGTKLLGSGVYGKDGLYGGYFTTDDTNGVALYGVSDETYAGVFGENSSTTGGYGVMGVGKYGLYGTSLGSWGAGIRGVASTSFSSYAGYFEGNVDLGRYAGATPVYLDLYDDPTPPSSADCDHLSEYGRMMLETTNHELYVCDDTGWKVIELAICGNGLPLEGNEICDDGDLVTQGCGNGIKESGTFCNSSCTSEYILDEACDYAGIDGHPPFGCYTSPVGCKASLYCMSECSFCGSTCLVIP